MSSFTQASEFPESSSDTENRQEVYLTEIEIDGRKWSGPEIPADSFQEAYVKATQSAKIHIVGSFLR